MPSSRGKRQQRSLAHRENPEELVAFKVRVPDRLRSKAHAAAAALNISTAVYIEQLLDAAPMPEPVRPPLPLAESA
jgi:predicted HicB family RNase H-like nuclease